MQEHELYTDADKDRPDVICDRNGQVVLSLCKRCGRAEAELDGPCVTSVERDAARYRYLRTHAIHMADYAFSVDEEVEAVIDAAIAAASPQ
jgi:hypothetical protein